MKIMCAFYGIIAFLMLVGLVWTVGYLLGDWSELEPHGMWQTIAAGALLTMTGWAIAFGTFLLATIFYKLGCVIHSLV